MIYKITEVLTPSGADGMEYEQQPFFREVDSPENLVEEVLGIDPSDEDEYEMEIDGNTVILSIAGGLIDGCSEGHIRAELINPEQIKKKIQSLNNLDGIDYISAVHGLF